MSDFLPRDPTAALVEVKEMLYDRLRTLRQCVTTDPRLADGIDMQMSNEIEFLEDVLAKIERS